MNNQQSKSKRLVKQINDIINKQNKMSKTKKKKKQNAKIK
jgi:hypothetical protein